MRFPKRKITGAILALVMALTIVVGAAGTVMATDRADALFERLRLIYDVVDVWHKDGADLDTFIDGAIQGGLEALGDPYTNYFTPEDYQDFMESLNGSFSGVGAYLEQKDNYIVIVSPIKNTPAFRAGLAPGDRILEANGTPLVGMPSEKAVKYIKGPAGTKVILKIERPSESRTFTVELTREQIVIPEVETKMLDAKVGYLQLSSFGGSATSEFYKGVADLKAQGAKALVLDLRGNGGGFVDDAIAIASGFIPNGQPIMWEVTREEETHRDSRGTLINLPTVVLVDGGSASASEILAGAIQDYGVAPLVGVKTFGKGTVQQLLNFTDGAGMKVTIAEYLTGKKRHVNKVGLTPDYVVEPYKPDPERTEPMKFTRFLSTSSVGLDVLYLQYRLQDLGYDVDTDGFFGLKTRRAVERFQLDNWLDQTPIVDAKFIEVLNQKVSEHTAKAEQKDLQLDKALELAQEKLK